MKGSEVMEEGMTNAEFDACLETLAQPPILSGTRKANKKG